MNYLDKLLQPYQGCLHYKGEYVRFSINEKVGSPQISYRNNFWRIGHIEYGGHYFNTKEAAMKALDKFLIDQGYILLNQNQVDKYKLLL